MTYCHVNNLDIWEKSIIFRVVEGGKQRYRDKII